MAKLYFRFAAMEAGKSVALMQVAHNYESHGRHVLLFTAAIDNRSGRSGVIESRLGLSREARTFGAATRFDADAIDTTAACVLIDEAQFLSPAQVKQLHRLAHTADIPVIAYGLRSDFRGEPFAGSAMLLTLSDTIEELKRVCDCDRKATMNIRVDDDGKRVREGEQILIGGSNRYRSVCPRCYYQDEGVPA